MPSVSNPPAIQLRRLVAAIATIISVGLVASACGFTADEAAAGDVAAPATATADVSVMDPSVVHDITVSFDEDAYDAMIDTYAAAGDKEWIEATVMIDGVTYEQVGLRLKGNSSLRGLGNDRAGEAGTLSADDPSGLPWLIRFDKYVEGQNHEGLYDVVIRSNNTETSLNEAVALDLLELAGLASQNAIAVAFSVNGSESTLRLAIEHPDDVWMDDNFADDGALYKAESTGDYSYRGDDPEAYDEVFDQEAGKDNEDLTPLIEFLDFINNTDDATFNAELADHLDIESFATYLAMQDLIDNFDDINGPGNNSYLYYDSDTEVFTVVAWDHNLAFGVRNNDAFGPGGAAAGDTGVAPAGGPGGAPGGDPGGGQPNGAGLQPPAGGPLEGQLPEAGLPV
ncbi:MAG: CotH kinase family protein, partial [Acidimicrobiia bacterium]